MKTTITLLAMFFGMMATVSAQDIITLKNGDEIKAKVQEIGLSDVKYKKFENANGPTYTLLKTEIFMIKYENGEKDVFTTQNQPVQEKQTLPPATPTVQQNNHSHVNDVTKQGKVALRDNNFEIGIQLDGGVGFFNSSDSRGNYEDSNLSGFMGGGGVFFDIYPNKRSWLLGTGISYWGHNYSGKDDELSLSYMNWDLYWGMREQLYVKIGLKFSFLQDAEATSGSYSNVDVKTACNSTVFGLMTELGYPTKHFDFGVKAFWMLSYIFKSDALSNANASSGIWGMAFSCAYRFSF
jgi:hypothetical protein